MGLDVQFSGGSELRDCDYPGHFVFYKAGMPDKSSLESVRVEVQKCHTYSADQQCSSGFTSFRPIQENDPFESYPKASWSTVMDGNLKWVFHCCQVFVGAMTKQSYGSIMNIASIYGLVSPDQS